jgi:pimeloyl-ACP methyl ester carboxylesterase
MNMVRSAAMTKRDERGVRDEGRGTRDEKAASRTSALEGAEVRTVRLDAGPIHYREIGEGPPLVFIHGLLVNGLLWRKVVPLLAERFRCIVPDLPLGSHATPMAAGADLTPPGLAKIVADFLAGLDLDGVTLIANDTGGAVTQVAVTRHPERVARLVLTPCDMFENFLPPMFRPLQWLAHIPGSINVVAQAMRVRRLQSSPLAFGWLAKHGIEADVAAQYLNGVSTSAAIRRDTAKVLRGISSRYTQEAAEALRHFDRPALLAWAREDRFFPVAHAQRMADLLPQGRLELIDDSYTFVSEDQPERLAQLIRDFCLRHV